MPIFPKLKTAAIAQYPLVKRITRGVRVLRYIDGTDQRFALEPQATKRWIVRLDKLDASEWRAFEDFFVALQGSNGRFSFTDPVDDTEYADCSLGSDEIELQHADETNTAVTLIIRTNVS